MTMIMCHGNNELVGLKPCPLCGAKASTELVIDPPELIVYCSNRLCPQPSTSAYEPEEAYEAWNAAKSSEDTGK